MTDKHFKYKLSYPDSKKIIEEAARRDLAIDNLIGSSIYTETHKQTLSAVNKLLYDTAEKQGISLYSLCFNTIPEYGIPEITKISDRDSLGYTFEQNIRLVPIEFDLTHDGGYWKEKYFKLKDKIQRIIDGKEDDV